MIKHKQSGFVAEYTEKQNEKIIKLQAKVERLEEEVERLKPKPLLFDTIGGFKVIKNDSVPEGEIWFATDKQLKMALEFSAKQLEQALKANKNGKEER